MRKSWLSPSNTGERFHRCLSFHLPARHAQAWRYAIVPCLSIFQAICHRDIPGNFGQNRPHRWWLPPINRFLKFPLNRDSTIIYMINLYIHCIHYMPYFLAYIYIYIPIQHSNQTDQLTIKASGDQFGGQRWESSHTQPGNDCHIANWKPCPFKCREFSQL